MQLLFVVLALALPYYDEDTLKSSLADDDEYTPLSRSLEQTRLQRLQRQRAQNGLSSLTGASPMDRDSFDDDDEFPSAHVKSDTAVLEDDADDELPSASYRKSKDNTPYGPGIGLKL